MRNPGGIGEKRELMRTKKPKDSAREFEKAVARQKGGKYVLRLFITGMTPRSIQAIENIKKICEEHLPDRYELEVIDIYQQPEAVRKEQVIASPTLIKKLPLPLRRIIGDLSNMERVLAGLDLRVSPNSTKE